MHFRNKSENLLIFLLETGIPKTFYPTVTAKIQVIDSVTL